MELFHWCFCRAEGWSQFCGESSIYWKLNDKCNCYTGSCNAVPASSTFTRPTVSRVGWPISSGVQPTSHTGQVLGIPENSVALPPQREPHNGLADDMPAESSVKPPPPRQQPGCSAFPRHIYSEVPNSSVRWPPHRQRSRSAWHLQGMLCCDACWQLKNKLFVNSAKW